MDVSVRKYNAQTNPSAAANFVPKIEPGATSDAFLSILSQVRVSASAEESAEKVFTRISQTASATHSIKKAEKPKAAASADKTGYVNSKASSSAGKPQSSSKPASETKTDTPDGQKIPAKENNARTEKTGETENNGGVTADASASETDKENTVETDGKVKKDGKEDASETETILTLGAAAAAVPAAAAAVQAAAVQNTAETFNSEEAPETVPEAVRAAAAPAAGEKPAETDAAAPEALKPQEILPETRTAAVPEAEAEGIETVQNSVPSTGEGDVETNEKTAADPAVTTGRKQETIPEEAVKRVVEEFAPPAEKAASAAPKANAPAPEKAARTETNRTAPQTAQEEDLAAKLPENVKAAVQVKTEAPENTVSRPVSEEEAGQADDAVPVKPVRPETTAKTGNTASAAAASETARNDGESRRNPDMGDGNRQMPNGVLPNAGAGAAQTAPGEQNFASVLKTASADGVSAVSENSAAGTTDGAHALFNVPGEGLKGKAVSGTSPASKPAVPTNELVDQIKVSITKAAKEGLEKININLKPKELGNIQVRLEVDGDGNMKASIIASRPETLDMLQKDASALRQALQDAGLKTNDNAFSFSYRGDQQSQQEAGRFAGNDRRQDSGRDIPAGGIDAASADDDLTEAIIASGWTGRHALNIRV